MSELLRQSIKTLSMVVNLSKGLTHPLDESRAKELFKSLHAEGEVLTYTSVKQLALNNEWPDRHADAIAKLAERISSGGRVVVKYPRHWGERTVTKIKEQLGNSKASL